MPKFEVYPINNASKRTGASVFVNASDVKRAESVGKYWLRVVGRRARHVRAEVYRPELDLSMSGYVRRTPEI
jgi:hypothetical protein